MRIMMYNHYAHQFKHVCFFYISDIESGLEQRKFRHWRQQGVTVAECLRDVCQMHDARELINETKKLGPVGGIFDLTMVTAVCTHSVSLYLIHPQCFGI